MLSRFLLIFASMALLLSASAAQTGPIIQSFGAEYTASAMAATATTFTKLADFGTGNGEYPNAPLAQGTDGSFYGTTELGPWPSNGFAFKMTPTGAFTLFDYGCTANYCTGTKPYAGLVLASDGNFYGTTSAGGDGVYRTTNKSGTIFQLNPQAGLSTIYNFCSMVGCQDGDNPVTPLIQGIDGNFYGTTPSGGANNGGTVFVVTAQGTLTTLHTFTLTEGYSPYGGLIQASDGNFYGTTLYGGACIYSGGCGTIFRMTPQGKISTLYSFCQKSNCADGLYPERSLLQAADGSLYGVTLWGGANTPPNSSGYGTVFKITTAGEFTSLYSFCALTNCADGYEPSGIIQATDGNFYGGTSLGGGSLYGGGTLFKLSRKGVLTTLHDFCPNGGSYCADGNSPGRLVQGTDGNFYGVSGGAISNHGTAFKLSVGLGPFIETITNSGTVGSSVIILGTNLNGATSVTFNGTAAVFTVVSNTEISTTVPTGATTGPVVVTAPSGILKSNQQFRIAR